MYLKFKSILPFISILILAACGGGGGGGGDGGGTSNGGYGTAPINTAPTINNSSNDYSSVEGETSGFMVNASDAEGNSLTYSVSGNDGSKMTVTTSGVVSFISAPDFEIPGDANGDNIYSFNVSVSDGNLSTAEGFTITVTNDTSDDVDTFAAWDGVLVKNDTYKPYDKHATSYNLIIGGLPDVTDGFVTNVANIANKMLAENDATNSVNRNLLLNNFTQYKAFQRVGSTSLSSYDPALNNDNYDGWDNINDNYSVVDFIWEATSKSVASTIAVTVAANNAGSGNVYVINDVQKSSLTLEVGKTYTFTHPTGHPLKFSTTSNGTWADGVEYTTGVTTSTSGNTVIEVTSNTPTTLYYYCSLHSGMGGTITVSASSDLEGTKAGQINAILEHLLHTITLIFDKSFTSWGYEDASSDLVLAMNEAIAGGYYDPTGNYGSTQQTNPTLYSRIIAQEFAYWMILTGWDLKALYAPDVAPEWTILTASEMETTLPLAHKLFTDTVNGVLINPTQAYLDGLTFSSLPTASTTPAAPATPTSMAVTIAVSVAANNSGSGNVYVIEGTQNKAITLEVGKTYTFTHPTAHPLRFSTTSDGTHSSGGAYSEDGTEYTTGVTTSTSGSTVIEVTSLTPTTLYYYCSVHSGMGGTITVSS
jgi:plastocyanin